MKKKRMKKGLRRETLKKNDMSAENLMKGRWTNARRRRIQKD